MTLRAEIIVDEIQCTISTPGTIPRTNGLKGNNDRGDVTMIPVWNDICKPSRELFEAKPVYQISQ